MAKPTAKRQLPTIKLDGRKYVIMQRTGIMPPCTLLLKRAGKVGQFFLLERTEDSQVLGDKMELWDAMQAYSKRMDDHGVAPKAILGEEVDHAEAE